MTGQLIADLGIRVMPREDNKAECGKWNQWSCVPKSTVTSVRSIP